jgi:hypothetical protein
MTTSRDEVQHLTENEQVFGFLLAIHGAVHAMGFVIGWRLFEFLDFDYEDVWPAAGSAPGRAVGVLWLVVAIVLVVAGSRLALRQPLTRLQLAVPLGASLVLTLTALPSALPGAVISGGILAAMGVLAVRRARFSPPREAPPRPGTERG